MFNTKRLEEKMDRLLELMEIIAKNTAEIAHPPMMVPLKEADMSCQGDTIEQCRSGKYQHDFHDSNLHGYFT